jgi:hypothetical protein
MNEEEFQKVINSKMKWVDMIPNFKKLERGTEAYEKLEKETIEEIHKQTKEINPGNTNFQNRVKGIMAQVIVLKLWNMVNPNIILQSGKKEDYLRDGKKGEFKAIFSTYPYKNGISDKTVSDVSKITPQMLSNYQSMVDEYSYVYMSDMDKGNVTIYTISTDELKKVIKENFNYIVIDFLDGEFDLFGNKKIMMHIPPQIIDKNAIKTAIYKNLIIF